MLNMIVLWISPLLLENVALRMGNLQVIKIRCSRVRTSLGCVLGALIRNGMGNLAYVFSVPCVLLLWFSYYDLVFGILWDVLMRPSRQRLLCNWVYSAAKFWNITMTILWRNKLLFIHIWDFVKCDIPLCEILWFNLRNFYVGKTGCYNWHKRVYK